jgi:methionyl-tRNA formyltransferase
MRKADVEIGAMAYATGFVPHAFCATPRFGTMEFHQSLVPVHRGVSSIIWAIIARWKEAEFCIFQPTNGLDEGPIIRQRQVAIEPNRYSGTTLFWQDIPARRRRVDRSGGTGGREQNRDPGPE